MYLEAFMQVQLPVNFVFTYFLNSKWIGSLLLIEPSQFYSVIKIVDSFSVLYFQGAKLQFCLQKGPGGTQERRSLLCTGWGRALDPFTDCGPVCIWRKRGDLGISPANHFFSVGSVSSQTV